MFTSRITSSPFCAAAAAEKRQLKQYSQKTTSSWCTMEIKQVWLDIWRKKVITSLLWWTGLHFQGSLGDTCTPLQWTDTFTVPLGFINSSAMQNEEHRKQAAKMPWISCAVDSSGGHYKAFQQVQTQTWSLLLLSPRSKVSLPFYAAWHFYAYRQESQQVSWWSTSIFEGIPVAVG